jgi:antitoxin component of RelBE/YafQ-DinJ toxin-antitoxin module
MTGKTQNAVAKSDGIPMDTLDPDSIERIDEHLQRALEATETGEADFHVRHARQLLVACPE